MTFSETGPRSDTLALFGHRKTSTVHMMLRGHQRQATNHGDQIRPRELQGGGTPFPATTSTFIDTKNCSIITALNTTYQANKNVIPYAGIMFSIATKSEAIDVLSFEFDLRIDLTRSAQPPLVQVYTTVGRFEEVISNATSWSLIADTTVVPAPEGVGSMIPVQSFTPVSIPPGSRQSFYITFEEAIMDSNIDALIKRDEVSSVGDHFDIYAGAGFDPPISIGLFPTAWSEITDPFFTGVIRYRSSMTSYQEEQCAVQKDGSQPLTISILYEFTLDQTLGSDTLQQLPSLFADDIDEVLNMVSLSSDDGDQELYELITNHSVRRSGLVQINVKELTGRLSS
jgi:hypothetical protein